MTPMIDVTFQLIIFFLIVTDMTAARIEILDLPSASKAGKEKVPDPNTVVVNVLKTGNIVIDGTVLHDHVKKPDDNKNLENFFKNRRNIQKYWFDATGKFVSYPLLIRADRAAEWIHIQKVLMICSQLGGVFKIQMGAKMEVEK